MIVPSATLNANEVARFYTDQKQKVPFAAVWALTQSAKVAESAIRDEMRRVLHSPREWTLRSLRTVPATKAKPSATVNYREFAGKGTPAGTYLRFLEAGGQRRHKRFERALIAAGVMRASQYAAPSRSAEASILDQDGNVPAKVIVRILSQLRAFGEQGYRANLSTDRRKRRGAVKRAGEQYFSTSVQRGKIAPGIYRRNQSTGRIEMVMAFVTRATYRRIFAFYDVGNAAAIKAWPEMLAQGMARYPARAR
jgi:hypothetical protein